MLLAGQDILGVAHSAGFSHISFKVSTAETGGILYTALVPREVPHAFTAVRLPAKMTIAFSPAGNMEQYFLDMSLPNSPQRDPAFYGVKVLGPPLKTV